MAREKKLANGFTRRQWAFIREYVTNGGNATRAAESAGYGPGTGYARGWELLQRADIVQAIQDETRKYIKTAGTEAIGILKDLAVNAINETVRYQAAADLANRSGYKLPDQVEVKRSYTSEEIDSRIDALLAELGEDREDIANIVQVSELTH